MKSHNTDKIEIIDYAEKYLEDCRTLWEELTEHHRRIYANETIGGKNPGLYFDEHLKQVSLDYIWLAKVEEKIVGLTSLIQKSSQEAEVEPLIVKQDYRNKKIGTMLLNHVIKEAKEKGFQHLSVRPVARNIDAIRFFHTQGFNVLGHIDMFMDLTEDTKEVKQWKGPVDFLNLQFRY